MPHRRLPTPSDGPPCTPTNALTPRHGSSWHYYAPFVSRRQRWPRFGTREPMFRVPSGEPQAPSRLLSSYCGLFRGRLMSTRARSLSNHEQVPPSEPAVTQCVRRLNVGTIEDTI